MACATILSTIAVELVDPRGRCNRKGLLVLAVSMLALQLVGFLGISVAGTGAASSAGSASASAGHAGFVGTVVVGWMAVAASVKRLHDLGRSGWWTLGTLVATVVWSFAIALLMVFLFGLDTLAPGSLLYGVFFTAVASPLMAALLWLHFAKGETGPNRYGEPPHGLGFGRPIGRNATRSVAVAAAA